MSWKRGESLALYLLPRLLSFSPSLFPFFFLFFLRLSFLTHARAVLFNRVSPLSLSLSVSLSTERVGFFRFRPMHTRQSRLRSLKWSDHEN